MRMTSCVTVTSVLLTACAWLADAVADPRLAVCPELMGQYTIGQGEEAMEAFRRLDLPGQYQVYICGSQYLHPPEMGLASIFAEGGRPVAEFLVAQLAQGVPDLTVRDIVRVFIEMRRQGTYDLASQTLFLRWLEARAEAIDDSNWREYVTSELIPELSGG